MAHTVLERADIRVSVFIGQFALSVVLAINYGTGVAVSQAAHQGDLSLFEVVLLEDPVVYGSIGVLELSFSVSLASFERTAIFGSVTPCQLSFTFKVVLIVDGTLVFFPVLPSYFNFFSLECALVELSSPCRTSRVYPSAFSLLGVVFPFAIVGKLKIAAI